MATHHTLTTEQLEKLVRAMGGGNIVPKMTEDPRVNYAVDCIVLLGEGDEPEYDEQLYADEIEVCKKVHAQFA